MAGLLSRTHQHSSGAKARADLAALAARLNRLRKKEEIKKKAS
jgi:hypothetical protein